MPPLLLDPEGHGDLIKVCEFPSIHPDTGDPIVDLFDPRDRNHMIKTAAPYLPEIQEYIARLRPRDNSIYALINAIGSSDLWGSNINGDASPERYDAGHTVYDQLLHKGPIWGYETFLGAHPFTHHKNKDPRGALGVVELSTWNPVMSRVELVVRLDREKCIMPAAQRVIQRIDRDELPDVSMGMKVPFDLSSVCTDWDLYNKALKTFDPRKHRHPGIAVLLYHKLVQPIHGLSVKSKEYCSHIQGRMNHILPDGRKIFVWNHWPRFFDISFVFIGAERQAKMMAKLADGRKIFVLPSAENAIRAGYVEDGQMSKVASVKLGARKQAAEKRAEKDKAVPPQFESKAVPILEDNEPTLPKDVLNGMAGFPLRQALSTPTMMGIVLKPQEFQRIALIRVGQGGLADELDRAGTVFAGSDRASRDVPMMPQCISKLLARLLAPHVEDRSVFGPVLRRRMIRITVGDSKPPKAIDLKKEKSPLLDKVAAAYTGYREQVIEKIASLASELPNYSVAVEAILGAQVEDLLLGRQKVAATDPAILLGAVPATYLLSALARAKTHRDYRRGRAPGVLVDLLGNHPHLAATAVGMAALKATGSKLPDKILAAALQAGKSLTRG